MAKKGKRVKPGPKPGTIFRGGRKPLVGLRMEPELTKRMDDWAARNGIWRSEAMRRLITKALDCEERARQPAE